MWERVAELLREQNMSVAELSRQTGIGKSTLSGWQHGKYRPKSDKRQKVADTLGVTLSYLDGYTDDRQPVSRTFEAAYPLYEVAAGQGRLNDGYPDELFYADKEEYECSWCRVEGDSMYPELRDGDCVKVLHTTETNPTDLTVIRIDGEAVTVKRIEVTENGIWVRAENKAVFEDRFYTTKEVLTLPISIVGIVTELRRKL